LGVGDLFGGHARGNDVSVFHPPVAVLAGRLGGGKVGPFGGTFRSVEYA
jgi:hypothetical protein